MVSTIHFRAFTFPRPWQTLIYFRSLWICLYWIFHINGIIQFCVWLLSRSIMFYPCHSVYWFFIPFYGITFHGMDKLHFVYLWIGWWLFVLFPPFGYYECAAMHTCVSVFVWMYVFISLGYIPRSGIAGTCDNSIFNCLKNSQIAFHSSYTILWSHEQWMKLPISSHPHQHLLSAFLIIDI